MAVAVVVVLLSCASTAALVVDEHDSPPPASMLQVIVPGGASADNATTLATMTRLVNVAMVTKPRLSIIFRGFPGLASELGWEGLDECDGRLPDGGEHVKLAVGNNPSDSESLFAGWMELTEEQAQAQPTTLSGFVHQVRTQPEGARPYSLFGLPLCPGYLAKVGLDAFDAVFGTAPGYFRAVPPNLYMHPPGGLSAAHIDSGMSYFWLYLVRRPVLAAAALELAPPAFPEAASAVHIAAICTPLARRSGWTGTLVFALQ